jgi:phosphoglycerate dehydrogenase-like enzyme
VPILVVDLAARSPNWALQPDGEQQVRNAAPSDWEVKVVRAPTSSDGYGGAASEESMQAVREAEVYFGFGMPKPLFESAKSLRWIQSAAAGVSSMMYPELVQSGVILTNSAGIHAIPIAEYVIGGVLYLLRGLDVAARQQRNREWNKQPWVSLESMAREAGESRVLIVGTGGIGQAVAERFSALGAECVGVRRRVELGPPPGFARVISMDALDGELAGADVVVLAAPVTEETRDLMTSERLALLPRHAIVVNVARGTLLDEDALARAIEDGRLRGAVLDVFQREPLATDSPLWQLDAVIVSPHISPVSPRRFWQRELALFLENWERYRAGAPMRNVVDFKAGY